MQNNCEISQSPLNKGEVRNISAKIQPALPRKTQDLVRK
jgi:hypothetical protein